MNSHLECISLNLAIQLEIWKNKDVRFCEVWEAGCWIASRHEKGVCDRQKRRSGKLRLCYGHPRSHDHHCASRMYAILYRPP